MPINASYEYVNAEKEYLNSQSLEDKMYWLEEMIKTAPKHKGSENLLAELKTRLKRFREKAKKSRKKSESKKGIRKEGYQFVMVGRTNVGKSSLLRALTNTNPTIAGYEFTTRKPELGTLQYEGVSAQIVDDPSVGCEQFDVGLVNNADCLLLAVESLNELRDLEEFVKRSKARRFVIVNKIDKLNEVEIRKLEAKMKSKRINGMIVSAQSGRGIIGLKDKLTSMTRMIRIYLKEPGKKKTEEKPMVLKEGATIKDVAEHILKGFSFRIKETRITGPSSKFSNQRVGLSHVVKDKDVVEFHTR